MSITTTDHTEIREWAESKGGKPASVDSTHKGGDVGIVRLMFPDSKQSEHGHLVEISWDEFFTQFDDSKLAMIYEPDSLFNKLVSRDTEGEKHAPAKKAAKHEPTATAAHKADDGDAASREYTDADGKVHHHTKAYMEKHAGDK